VYDATIISATHAAQASADAEERDAEADGVEVVRGQMVKGHARTVADLTTRQGCGPML
jgi:hypothetical protein